jgi:hypothetical protein
MGANLDPVPGKSTLMRIILRTDGIGASADPNHATVFRTAEGRRMAVLHDTRAVRPGAYAASETCANDVAAVAGSQARRIFPRLTTAAGVLPARLVAILDNS